MLRRAIEVAFVVVGVGPLAAGAASADEGPVTSDVWSKTFAVAATLGLGTPVGYYGLSLEWAPHPAFVVSLGAGQGSGRLYAPRTCMPSGYAGVCGDDWTGRMQYSALARVRVWRSDHSAIALGAGPSMGGYSWTELTTDEPAHKSAARAWWWNVELSREWRAGWGASARVFVGYAWMLNPGDLLCVETGVNDGHCQAAHGGDGRSLLYLGGSLGWAL